MINAIKSVKGVIVDDLRSSISSDNLVSAEFGYGDWFELGKLTVFNQDLSKVISVNNLNKNKDLGFNVNRNKEFIEIEISY